MLEAVHVDAVVAEVDTFELEAGALFGCGWRGKLDVATGADDAVPGELVGWVGAKEAGDGSMVEGVAGGGSDVAVGADSAGRDGEDDAAEGEVA